MENKNQIDTLKLDLTFPELSKHSELDISWILKYPQEDWNWFHVSEHPNVSLEWLLKGEKILFKLNGCGLSRNPNLKLDWIEQVPEFNWDWEYLLETQDIHNPRWLQLYPTKIWKNDYWKGVSKNKNLSTDFVHKYITKPWKWMDVIKCPNFEFCWLDKYLQEVKKNIDFKEMIFQELSLHPKLELSWLEKYPLFPWDYMDIAKHPNFNIEWTKKIIDGKWTFEDCKGRPDIIIKRIREKNESRHIYALSRSKDVDYEFILQNIDLDWNWGCNGISINPNFTKEWFNIFHDKRKHMHWGHGGLSSNPSFKADWIINNRKKAWDVKSIIKNNPEEFKIVKEKRLLGDKARYWAL